MKSDKFGNLFFVDVTNHKILKIPREDLISEAGVSNPPIEVYAQINDANSLSGIFIENEYIYWAGLKH